MNELTWRTVKRRVNELVPYEKNPRILTDDRKEKLLKSFEKFNLVEIPVINKDNVLLAGHQRLKILKLLGRGDEVIDVRFPNRKLNEQEVKEYLLTSNIQIGYWDIDVLKSDFSDVDLIDLGLDLESVFIPEDLIEAELDLPIIDLIEQVEKSELPELPENPKTIQGDLIELVSPSKKIIHRIQCGDSTNKKHIKKLLDKKRPKMMVTDPPYGVNYDPNWRTEARSGKIASTGLVLNDDQCDWTEVWKLVDADVAYVWHAALFAAKVQKSLEANSYQMISQIIWNKNSFVLSRGDYHWKHETCWYAVKKGVNHNWQGPRDQSTVWDIQNLSARGVIEREGQTGHGTQKPLECMRRPIMNNSERSVIICDPFLGSGTTLIACEETGRVCYGQELSEAYCDVIVKRWINYMLDNNLPFEIKRNGQPLSPSEYLNPDEIK